jgi:hypothetical protein
MYAALQEKLHRLAVFELKAAKCTAYESPARIRHLTWRISRRITNLE